jgi:aminoglycoside phosphotransferase (APT) family kinase protein
MATDFPQTIDQVTPAWLSGVLGITVADYQVTFLEGGNLSDAFKLHHIRYDAPAPSAPASLVLKFPHSLQASRDNAAAIGAYIKEVRFFRDIAPNLDLRTPRIYTLEADGSATAERFVIAMEDLTVHSRVFDQVEDPPTEEFARKMALEVASMHAAYWESPILEEPWLSRSDGRYLPSVAALSVQAPGHAASYREQWARVYGEDKLGLPEWRDVERLHELLTGPKCAEIHDAIFDTLSSRPRTLIHGDLRADNVFRSHPATCADADAATLTYIDWQLVGAGPPGPEFTEAWMHSLPSDLRRLDLGFLREYHDRLLMLQPDAAAYGYDDLCEDYTLSLCFWWSALVTLGDGVLPTFDTPAGARNRRLWDVGVQRSFAALRDHGCLQRVQDILADLDRA